MKSSRRRGINSFFSSSSSTTVTTYTLHNDQTTPPQDSTATEIPIKSSETPVPIAVHVPTQAAVGVGVEVEAQSVAAAATKIQSSYRAHMIRKLYRKISAVNSEAHQLQRLIQRQETVDALRCDEREKIRVNEALMALLLRLDSVPGWDQGVREARRKVSRRIVGLQEIVDGITETNVCDDYCGDVWFLMRNWDEVIAEMEEQVCRDRGGEELERFCAQYLGFRCLQRFLREP